MNPTEYEFLCETFKDFVRPQQNVATQTVAPAADEDFINHGPINCVEELDCAETTAEISVQLPCLIGTERVNIKKDQDGHNVEIKIERSEAAEGEDISRKPVMAKLTGHKDHLEAAKAELIALSLVIKEYEMPSEYHGILLGQRRAGIRPLCEEFQKLIGRNTKLEEEVVMFKRKKIEEMENAQESSSVIADEEPKVIDDQKSGYAEKAESRSLQSYQLELVVSQLHSKLIGIDGDHITKLRDEFDVNIQMPDKSMGDSETIKITGFRENAENAAKAVRAFFHNIKDVQIDNSVNNRDNEYQKASTNVAVERGRSKNRNRPVGKARIPEKSRNGNSQSKSIRNRSASTSWFNENRGQFQSKMAQIRPKIGLFGQKSAENLTFQPIFS